MVCADYDNDGDLDIALMGQIPGQRIAKVYRNDAGAFTEETSIALTPADNGDLEWGDYDNDGDLDLAIIGQLSNDFQTALKIYRNDPVGTLTEDTRTVVSGSFASALAWGDHDSDGDLDLVITGFDVSANARVTRLLDNDGTGLLTESALSITGVAAADLAWGDFDNDGDLDLAILGNAATGPILEVYRNNNGTFASQAIDVLEGLDFGALGWADIDADGDLDLLSSGRASADGITFAPTSRANDNLESRFNPNQAPGQITGLSTSTEGADVRLTWLPGNDAGSNPTPVAALTYEVRVGATAASNDIRSGTTPDAFGSLRTTSLVLRNMPSGSYFWSVRAIDSGIATSEWAEDNPFIVDTVSPVIDSIQVRPRILTQGRRASVVVDFNDEPAGMDNSVSPSVTIQLANQGDALILNQLSYSGDLWIGEVDVETEIPAGSIVVRITGAKDLKGNTMLPFEQTIPALIARGQGGVVESPDGTVKLDISPNVLPATLSENPDVRIDPVATGAEPSGVTASYGAYEVTSDPAITLRKAATLTFDVPQGASADRLAVYQLTGANWTRLGGTVFEGKIRVPITDLSTYGLFEDSGTTAGSATISNIEFSNRAFTPRRRQAGLGAAGPRGLQSSVLTQTTDISFDLTAAATVRIEVYNRSGQLQTILEPGRQMNAGCNIVSWDGFDHEGDRVRSGLYIVSIEADGEREQKTVAVVNR